MAPKFVTRLSISCPQALASDLNFVSRRLSISKSAIVTTLLQEGLRDFRMLLESLPPDPDDKDMARFRGASAEMIVARMQSIVDDIAENKGFTHAC